MKAAMRSELNALVAAHLANYGVITICKPGQQGRAYKGRNPHKAMPRWMRLAIALRSV